MIYTITLNPALDYVMDTGAVRWGEVNRSTGEMIFAGGKGINISYVLSELKISSTALGFIAGFTGDYIESELMLRGIKTDFCRLPDGITRINVKLRGEEVTEINGSGPFISGRDMKSLYDKLDLLGEGDTLVLAGSIPPSLQQDTYEKLLSHVDGRGVRTVVDATGRLLTDSLKHRPFLIKPNVHELSEIVGRTLSDVGEIEIAAREMRNMGAVNVLVSMGGDGALLIDEHGEKHFRKAFVGKAVNTVGAGDSTVAGFLAGAEHGYGTALLYGCAAGAATAFSEGLAKRDDIFALISTASDTSL